MEVGTKGIRAGRAVTGELVVMDAFYNTRS